MHASFNASGQLGVVDGDWQPIGALMAVTDAFLYLDVRRARLGESHETRSSTTVRLHRQVCREPGGSFTPWEWCDAERGLTVPL